MKKALTLTALALLLAACGNNDKAEEQPKEETKKETTTEKPTTEKPTTEKATTEEKEMTIEPPETSEQPKQSDEEPASSYPVDEKGGVAYLKLPSFNDSDFKEQILSNNFNIKGIRVGEKADVYKILGKPSTVQGDGREIYYNNFVIGMDGDIVSKITVRAEMDQIPIEDLRQAWNKPFDKTFLGANGFPTDVYDGDKTNDYHVEVTHIKDVQEISIYKGDVKAENSAPSIDVLSDDFINKFNKRPENILAGIYPGMTREELLRKYGLPNGHLPGEGGSLPMYGDVTVRIISDVVDHVGVHPKNLTVKELKAKWGKPTREAETHVGPNSMVYDSDPNNGYQINVFHINGKVYEVFKQSEGSDGY